MTLLLRAEYGSRAYGTNNEFSDHDFIEVHLEPPSAITGLDSFKTRMQKTAEDGARSTKDDIDTTIYGLQTFVSLCADGNPSLLSVLFLSEQSIEFQHPLFVPFVENRSLFVSKSAGRRFQGYARSQLSAVTGARNKRTNRPELVHTHGWDVKFGMHMIRLGYLGLELMETGGIVLPLQEPLRSLCRDIRDGKVSKEEGVHLAESLDAQLDVAIEGSDLPEHADRDSISVLLHDAYMSAWASK